jgi:hypothetical protein
VPAASTSQAFSATTSVVIPASTYAAGSAELGGWTTLQKARVLCGFGALTQNAQLDAASLAHAKYLSNISVTGTTSLLSHYETIKTDPNYSGYFPWDRSSAKGYGTLVAEILESTVWNYDSRNPPAFPTMEQRGADSMSSLLNTVYHLVGAMYDGADVGFGASLQTVTSGTAVREEYRFGSLNGYQNAAKSIKLGTGNLATFPCNFSANIPTTFVPANESPNPFPTMTTTSQTVGPPIYLKVDAGQVLVLTSSSVMNGATTVATSVLNNANDPQKKIGTNEIFVVPSVPLVANTSYQVILNGTINNKPFTRNFTMTTGL